MKQESFFELKDKSLFYKSNGKKLSLETEKIHQIKFDQDLLSVAGDDFAEITSDLQKKMCEKNGEVLFVEVPYNCVALGDGNYDENFLARLRDFLKNIESANLWAIFSVQKQIDNGDAEIAIDDFIETVYHTARRIKDCACVIGTQISADFSVSDVQNFVEKLAKKHPYYFYFTENFSLYEF